MRFESKLFVLLLAAVLLTGCAASIKTREGRSAIGKGEYSRGLGLLNEAGPTYRQEFLAQREVVVATLVQRATDELRAYRFDSFEATLGVLTSIDSTESRIRTLREQQSRFAAHAELLKRADQQLSNGSLAEAELILERLLADNGSNPQVVALAKKVALAKQATEKVNKVGAQIAPRLVTLDFKDAPLRSIFSALASATGINFVFDKDLRVDTRATIVLRDVEFETALDLLASSNQLEKRQLDMGTYWIGAAGNARSRETQDLILKAFYLNSADPKLVAANLKALFRLKEVVVDEKLNAIFLREPADVVAAVEKFVQMQDLVEPEVMLELEVFEISRSKLLDLGVQLPTQIAFTALDRDGGTSGMSIADLLTLNSARVQASFGQAGVTARGTDGWANILANPRVRAKSKDKAKIHIGDRVPAITTSSNQGVVNESTQYLEVGIKLEVEPIVYAQNDVGLKVALEVSSISREIRTPSGALAYQIGARSASTTLRLKDGETQILGGLISEEERNSTTGLPFLSSLPLLGRVFGSQNDSKTKTEILLAITPRVVRALAKPQGGADQYNSGTESAPKLKVVRQASAIAEPITTSTAGQPTVAQGISNPTLRPQTGSTATVVQPASAVFTTRDANKIETRWQRIADDSLGKDTMRLVLMANADGAISLIPLRLKFDPKEVEVLGVVGGDFFKLTATQNSGIFGTTIDAVKGEVSTNLLRSGLAKANASGSIVELTVRVKDAASAVKIDLLESSPSNEGRPISMIKPGTFTWNREPK